MNSTHGQCSLYLCPEKPAFEPEQISALVNVLQDIGLIAKKVNPLETDQHYYTGEKYLDYIAYMGCAPSIQFEASDNNEKFCFIKIHQYPEAQLIYSQKQTRAPHCPHCKKPVKNWLDTKSSSVILCNFCNTTSNIEDFDWRKMAGFARLFIEITDIFPKEAMPQQLLLDKLSEISGVRWRYFYSCD